MDSDDHAHESDIGVLPGGIAGQPTYDVNETNGTDAVINDAPTDEFNRIPIHYDPPDDGHPTPKHITNMQSVQGMAELPLSEDELPATLPSILPANLPAKDKLSILKAQFARERRVKPKTSGAMNVMLMVPDDHGPMDTYDGQLQGRPVLVDD